ncbi:MAG: hypothetical protein QHH13_10450 [Melioribacter sp.]|uniref:hypothetical protein n=1 Tax=Rosettibacter primus TaxID=3111523 RepID=UPI00247D4004|nr:hypothetical protein [Melioribacter sp.]
MEHIEESTLELFAYNPEKFLDNEKDKIIQHLKICKYCEELYKIFTAIHSEINKNIDIDPDGSDILLAEKIANNFSTNEKLLHIPKVNSIVVHDAKFEIIEKPQKFSLDYIRYFIKSNPIKSIGFSFSLALLIITFITLFQSTYSLKSKNPVTLSVYNFILKAYNKNGDLLWKMNVDGLPRWSIDSLTMENNKYLYLYDIDNDNKNELLLTGFRLRTGLYKNDTLYCFNYDGTLRWKISPENNKYNYAPQWKRTEWRISNFFVANRNKQNILYIIANDNYFGSCVISTINPITGEVTSSLYHSGHLSAAAHFDIDNDGDEEIFLGGVSSYYKPCLIVVDTDKLMGVMPDFYSSGHKVPGNAYYYILLPVTDVAKNFSVTKSIGVTAIEKFGKNGVLVFVNEYSINTNVYAALEYVFDNNFVVQYITATPTYLKLFEQIKNKKITSVNIVSDFLKPYKDSLQYWDGNEFVYNPVPNKYKNQKFQLPE